MEARRDPAAVASSAETLDRLVANLRLVVHAHFDRQKRRIVDPDPDLFNRRHQDVAVALLAHDRGE